MVKIYGHYALIEGAKITFHRHLIRSFDFTEREGNNRWTAYKFVRKVYDHFAPIHLKRIQSAVARLREPNLESFTSVASADESEQADSQESATSAPTSQDTDRFKKPRLTATAMLREQLAQRDQQLAQRDQQFMLLLKQQTPSNANETETNKKRSKATSDRELMNLLKGQEDRQKEQMDRQKEQMDRQKEQMDQQKEQMDRQKEQMDRQIEELKREKDEQRRQIQSLIATLATNTRPQAS
ncbi:hypothetical protein MMC17_010113 [Xylographa soralifera]|nr:hypothetical protein [Xylographa soralifera]